MLAVPVVLSPASVPFHAVSSAVVISERVAILLGVTTLVFGLATVTSCRSFVWLLNRIGLRGVARSAGFQAYYRHHGTYWFIFGGLLAAHLTMAITHTGLPQAGDPDAPVHWAILLAGLSAGLIAATSFASCRILPRLTGRALDPARQGGYRRFIRFHGYYWWLFVLIVAAHFAVGYWHAGIWPH